MCNLCNKKPVYEFTNKRKLCKNCFIRYFQKKVLYTNRKFKLIQKHDIIYPETKNSLKDSVLKNILNLFVEKGIIELTTSKKKADKIAISNNLDTESNKIIHELIQGNTKKLKEFSPKNKTIIKPLYLFLDTEIKLYAKIKKLKSKDSNAKKDNITKFVNNLEKKHPEIKRAIVNSYLELYD